MEGHARAFARISRDLLSQKGETLTLQRIADLAVKVVPAADHVGITLRSGTRIETAASTHPLVDRADQLQYELNEGPCLEASRAAGVYITDDTRADPRWPRWGPMVADLGIRSVLSVHLIESDGDPLGAVNLYAAAPGAYSAGDVDDAHIFAHHAAGALEASREIGGLRNAMHSRHVIGVAQGMIMQRYGVSVDRAFDVLLRRSQDTNVKVRDLATFMITTGRIPEVITDPTTHE